MVIRGKKLSFDYVGFATAIFVFSICINIYNCFAINSAGELEKVLISYAAFSQSDIEKMRKGEAAVKLLPSPDNREVSVLGVIPIKSQTDVGLKEFQTAMSRQNKKSIMEFGDFGSFPKVEDIEKLTLEKNDIEDLRKCVVGKCSLRLSATMIERFRREIDWKAPDHSEQVMRLFRQMLIEYLQDYLARGDEALMEYRNQANALSLREEQKSLLDQLTLLNDFDRKFSSYLRNFPKVQLNNVTKSLSWTKLRFGLKPVVIITQTITYTVENKGVSQMLSVSKQIYATRYFDSSLGLTAIIKFPDSAAEFRTFLLYTNHSRSSSLDGAFSKLKHEIVEREAIEKLKSLLEDAKLRLENPTKSSTEPLEISNAKSFKIWISENIFWLSGVALALLFLGFAYKRLKKR